MEPVQVKGTTYGMLYLYHWKRLQWGANWFVRLNTILTEILRHIQCPLLPNPYSQYEGIDNIEVFFSLVVKMATTVIVLTLVACNNGIYINFMLTMLFFIVIWNTYICKCFLVFKLLILLYF